MTELAIKVPDTLSGALRKAPHELAREMCVAAAIHWYQQSALSMESAAEVAGMDRPQFLKELASRQVDVFQLDDVARELRSI